MKKISSAVLAVGLSAIAQGSVIHGTITESTHTWTSETNTRTPLNAGVSDQDTLQTTAVTGGKLTWSQKVWKSGTGSWVDTTGPGWGGKTTQEAVSDAGSEWWQYGGNTTFGADSGDAYVDMRWTDNWGPWDDNYNGRTLDRIDILVTGNGNTRPNYAFKIEHLNTDWSTWTDVTDGFHTVSENPHGTGTLISITDIDLADTRGIRITSKRLDQNIDPGVTTWVHPQIQEIDVYLVPEPGTLGLISMIGGAVLFIRRRFVI